MKKILNEWRSFYLNEGHDGLYRLMNIPKGTLDVFLDIFTSSMTPELQQWIRQSYGELIEQQPPEIRQKLENGFSYNWYRFLGPNPTRELIEKMVEIYHDALNTPVASNLPVYLQKPEGEMTPSEKRTYRRIMKKRQERAQSPEKEWISDKANFDELMRMIRVRGVRGDIEHSKIQSGLFGQMSDWWLGSEIGSGMFEDAMNQKFHGGQ